MADRFAKTAQTLRNVATGKTLPCAEQRQALRHAADTLCQLGRLRQNLLRCDPSDDAVSCHLTSDLMTLLGIHQGS